MPTKRKRHAITETPPVEAALNELREELGTERVDLGEIVVLGAREKLRELQARRNERQRLLDDLAARVRSGDTGVDLDAAIEVKRKGLIEL